MAGSTWEPAVGASWSASRSSTGERYYRNIATVTENRGPGRRQSVRPRPRQAGRGLLWQEERDIRQAMSACYRAKLMDEVGCVFPVDVPFPFRQNTRRTCHRQSTWPGRDGALPPPSRRWSCYRTPRLGLLAPDLLAATVGVPSCTPFLRTQTSSRKCPSKPMPHRRRSGRPSTIYSPYSQSP